MVRPVIARNEFSARFPQPIEKAGGIFPPGSAPPTPIPPTCRGPVWPVRARNKREAIAELTALAVSMGRDPGTAHRLASAVADRWFPDVTPPKHRHRSRDGRGSPCWPSPKQRGGPAPRAA